MRIQPSNQTLILASDRSLLPMRANARAPLDGKLGVVLGQAVSAASNGAMIKHLTIVAAQPDTTVYLQADYAPNEATAVGNVIATQSKRISLDAAAGGSRIGAATGALVDYAPLEPTSFARLSGGSDSYGNPVMSGSLWSAVQPTEQYAQTQRNLSAASTSAYVDVFA